MSTFGEKLKAERERRNTPLSDVAARTRIGIQYLEALERDDFDELPGPRGFGKLYIRAYAELLGFDPAPLIREYDDVVHERLREAGEDESEPTRPRVRRVRYVPPPRGGANGRTNGEAELDEPELPELEDVEDLPIVAAEPAAPAAVVSDAIERTVESLPEPTDLRPPTDERPRRVWLAGAAAGAIVFLAVLGLLLRGGPSDATGTTDVTIPAEEVTPPPVERSAAPVAAAVIDEPVVTAPSPEPVESIPPVPEPVATDTLRVTTSGVGSGIENLRLVGEASTFSEGQVVSFLTRVRGGVVGQRIRHVWMHEGRTIQSIPLRLGGANWRTYSNKTVYGRGAWAVEARAADGTVLARATFDVRRR